MKKLFVFPILLLYMLAQSGMLVHLHYCGVELASWELFQKSADACGDDGCDEEAEEAEAVAMEEDGCCKDKVVSVKITSDQSHEKIAESFFAGAALLPLPVFTGLFPQENTFVSGREKLAYSANAPPGRWQNLPLYKLHMRFTFYG